MLRGRPCIGVPMYRVPWLRAARLKAQISARQLALNIGVSETALLNWERGGRTCGENVKKLKHHLRDRNARCTGGSGGNKEK